ncbi:hypothetical protein [Candidatus Liberibacter solanacearum]|nr:hypothetical protein [Candidatus Liberibacter solanacearum]
MVSKVGDRYAQQANTLLLKQVSKTIKQALAVHLFLESRREQIFSAM